MSKESKVNCLNPLKLHEATLCQDGKEDRDHSRGRLRSSEFQTPRIFESSEVFGAFSEGDSVGENSISTYFNILHASPR